MKKYLSLALCALFMFVCCIGLFSPASASGLVDTSASVDFVDTGIGSNSGFSVNQTGFSVTRMYSYVYDLNAIKASGIYNSDTGTVTAGKIGALYIVTPCKNIESVPGHTTDYAANSYIVMYADNASYFASNNSQFKDGPSSAATYISLNVSGRAQLFSGEGNFGVRFTLSSADIDNSYVYWRANADDVILPIGVRSGDILFAGKNTPYYGMTNIDGTLAVPDIPDTDNPGTDTPENPDTQPPASSSPSTPGSDSPAEPTEGVYYELYYLFQNVIYGSDAELTPDQTLTLTLLSTFCCLFLVLLPFLLFFIFFRR